MTDHLPLRNRGSAQHLESRGAEREYMTKGPEVSGAGAPEIFLRGGHDFRPLRGDKKPPPWGGDGGDKEKIFRAAIDGKKCRFCNNIRQFLFLLHKLLFFSKKF